jgi:peptidoglycan hydrolase-like protein with peptidoglycan-binding domain
MKRIIKLTENQLRDIVSKVIKEQSVVNVNPKNLKFGDRGDDVKKLQQLLMNKGYLKTDTMVPTGFFGKLTTSALKSFLSGGVPLTATPSFLQGQGVKKPAPVTQTKQQPQTQEKPVSSSGDYLIIIAFPQYEPKVDKGETVSWIEKAAIYTQTGETPREGTYGKIGHAGVALISKLGDVKLFEFGRYNTEKGKGVVKSKILGKIAKIDSSGKFINAREVAKIVKSNTQGEGPRLDMVTAVVPVPSLQKAKAFAEGPAIREYEAVDMKQGGAANCGTFAIDTAKAGGVPIGDFCYPMPVKMISKFKEYSSEYFNV